MRTCSREVRGCEVVAIADINSARVSQIAHDLAIAATYQGWSGPYPVSHGGGSAGGLIR